MPKRSITVHSKDAPWMTCELKSQIRKRQLALQQGNDILFKYYRNLVNRNRKKCRGNYYENKISHLKNSKPKNWWREVKQICGHAPLIIIKTFHPFSWLMTPIDCPLMTKQT